VSTVVRRLSLAWPASTRRASLRAGLVVVQYADDLTLEGASYRLRDLGMDTLLRIKFGTTVRLPFGADRVGGPQGDRGD
jgi:hypothetical protein